jgi:hypothetical protein
MGDRMIEGQEGAAEPVLHFEASEFLESELGAASALEVPQTIVVEGGREVIRVGDVEQARALWEPQGKKAFGFRGTCGLASIAGCLRMLGFSVTENDIVRFAAEHGLCNVSQNPSLSGGTTALDQVALLKQFGIPAHAEQIKDVVQIARAIVNGQGVLVGLDAGLLWKEEMAGAISEQGIADAIGAGHSIQVVGVAVDPQTHGIVGFYVNDTGVPQGAGRFVTVEAMKQAVGGPVPGVMVVTDLKPAPPSV